MYVIKYVTLGCFKYLCQNSFSVLYNLLKKKPSNQSENVFL